MANSLAEATTEAKKLVAAAVGAAAGVGWMPGSSLLLGGIDIVLIKQVAAAFEVEDYSIEQVITTIGKRFAGKLLATELLSFIPGPGWAIKGGVAASVTGAAGALLVAYMKDKSPLV